MMSHTYRCALHADRCQAEAKMTGDTCVNNGRYVPIALFTTTVPHLDKLVEQVGVAALVELQDARAPSQHDAHLGQSSACLGLRMQ